MLSEKQIQEIREELDTCKRPLFFFHDDADGLCSFLLLYRYIREGKGIIIKTTPKIDSKFTNKVLEYAPDKIFVVDIAIVEQEFIDEAKTPIIWIDHHSPLQRTNIKYYNPRIENQEDNIPISKICYDIVKEDMWIAAIGAVADWHWPDFIEEFRTKYPDLLPKEINDPETALFESNLGKLIDIVSFALKGTTQDAMKCAKIFTRIKSPYEILKQETSQGKFLYKKYEQIKKEYNQILQKAIKTPPQGKLILFQYMPQRISLTKDLANELLHKFPEHIIIIAREKSGEMKMSIRSKTIHIPEILEDSLKDVEGYGGGHELACGANVKKDDFPKFIENFKKHLK